MTQANPRPVLDMQHTAERLLQMSSTLLERAPLNARQHEDMQAIREAAQSFLMILLENRAVLNSESTTAQELQTIRHDLRNVLNVIVGYTRILIRELPDNLLLYMASVREMYDMGQRLLEQTQQIR